jgi:hypothetical protein
MGLVRTSPLWAIQRKSLAVSNTLNNRIVRVINGYSYAQTHTRCGETAELEGREPTINTPLRLSWHPKGILEQEQFWLEVRRKRVTG